MDTAKQKWSFHAAFIDKVGEFWPTKKQCDTIRSEHMLSYSNDEMHLAKIGQPVSKALILTLILGLQKFGESLGLSAALRKEIEGDPETILNKIAFEDFVDYTLLGVEGVQAAFESQGSLDIQSARTKRDNNTASEFYIKTLGIHYDSVMKSRCQKDPDSLTLEECNAVAQRAVGFNDQSFFELLERFSRLQPNSTCFATIRRERVGCCTILSLTDEAYEKFKAGRLGFRDIDKKHLAPSPNLLAFAKSDPLLCRPQSRTLCSLKLMKILGLQFSKFTEKDPHTRFRVVSFDGSPSNAARLAAWAFTHNGKIVPDSPTPLRINELRGFKARIVQATLRGLVAMIKDEMSDAPYTVDS